MDKLHTNRKAHMKLPQTDTPLSDGQEPLVSVMVPVYNVERYLPQCLDSILAQTYRNLDIVLLDDGSTDGGGAVCDEYATRDSRIRVTHVANGGLSRARNRCLELARAELLLFVDSDDWIEPETVRTLVDALIEADADMACCQHVREWADHTEWPSRSFDTCILQDEEILDGLFKKELIATSAWSKLYRAKLFQGINYPDGHVYEDAFTTHRICMATRCVVCVKDVLFHYRKRKGAITNSYSTANLIDYWLAQVRRFDDINQATDKYRNMSIDHCLSAIGRTWRWWAACPKNERRLYSREISGMRDFAREHTTNVLNGEFKTLRKVECLLGRWATPVIWIPLYLATRLQLLITRNKRAEYQ